jgi:hypothetical protein
MNILKECSIPIISGLGFLGGYLFTRNYLLEPDVITLSNKQNMVGYSVDNGWFTSSYLLLFNAGGGDITGIGEISGRKIVLKINKCDDNNTVIKTDVYE